jgi:putative hemolysin
VSLESWIESIVAIVALILLGLAAFADVSLTRKQRLSVRDWLESGNLGPAQENPVEQASALRLSLLTIMLLSVALFTVMVVRITARELGSLSVLWAMLAGFTAVLIVARGLPQALVERFDTGDSASVERLTAALLTLTSPFIGVIDRGAALITWMLKRSAAERARKGALEPAQPSRQDEGSTFEQIHGDEQEMISGILSMDEAVAREIMVPRPDVIAVPVDMPLSEVVDVVQQAGHSRIPVFEGSIDRIVGIVYAKDLLRFVAEDPAASKLTGIMRSAVFVPESKRVDDLLTDLRRSRVHIAVVVDEYGGTAGIVTIEDILEEIVGEIQDEYDRELPLYQFASSGEITVDGRISVDELSELIGCALPESSSETVGGFVQQQLGHIPDVGETVEAGVVTIQVASVEGRRVRALKIRRSDQQRDGAASSLRAV